MKNTSIQTKGTSLRVAKFCIGTILYQDVIAYYFRAYVVAATLVIMFLHLAGVISTSTVMVGLFIGGLAVLGLVWSLIQARKKALLSIQNPELKAIAHDAMIIYLSRKRLSKKERRLLSNQVKDKAACWFEERC